VAAVAVFVAVFCVFNANGRELSSYDSQPAKYTALEIARYRTLVLDTDVSRLPDLANRAGFAVDRFGHWRSAYPPLPGLLAGGVGTALKGLGVLDLAAPPAASLIAKLTASLLTALSVSLGFLIARRRLSTGPAVFVALGFGLGTNLWAQTSQTLWQSETAIAALCAAVYCIAVPSSKLTTRRLWLASVCLGLAGAARAQLAPAILVFAGAIVMRRRRPHDAFALLPLIAIGCMTAVLNLHWFGHLLGGRPQLEAAATMAHAVEGPIGNPITGALGLLISPSRGLLIFSPIVLVVFAGLPAARAQTLRDDLPWCAIGALLQFGCYATYSAWWGGHSYGPRLCLDLLPFLLPLAATGMEWVIIRPWRRWGATVLLLWSMLVAGTGAFVYPYDAWNIIPVDVDLYHERLWDWRDVQFVRAWQTGISPQNFQLFSADSYHRRIR
jgi:hypothetical protein